MNFEFRKIKKCCRKIKQQEIKNNQKMCDNQNQSQNQRKIIKKRLLVVHTQFGFAKIFAKLWQL